MSDKTITIVNGKLVISIPDPEMGADYPIDIEFSEEEERELYDFLHNRRNLEE